jgi:hypothetical protein
MAATQRNSCACGVARIDHDTRISPFSSQPSPMSYPYGLSRVRHLLVLFRDEVTARPLTEKSAVSATKL